MLGESRRGTCGTMLWLVRRGWATTHVWLSGPKTFQRTLSNGDQGVTSLQPTETPLVLLSSVVASVDWPLAPSTARRSPPREKPLPIERSRLSAFIERLTASKGPEASKAPTHSCALPVHSCECGPTPQRPPLSLHL